MNDYRPVALTSSVMKSFEKIVLDCVLCEVQNKLYPLQFAFRRGRSKEDALCICCIDFIVIFINQSDMPVLFIDFSSAFNTIRPHILMERLFKLGVNSRLIRWVESFLTDRLQCVRV